jgi:primosomal protein N' (replication factor Y)
MPTVIHGVTGSGKTEVYKKLITATCESGKTVILLLPEVTLAIQFYNLLRKQLPSSIELRSFHSATTIKEKKQTWQLLVSGHPLVLLGVHLPILLPIANLGLIIVDEEHDVGYQEKKHPKINSKEAAIWRAHLYSIPIVLGSATPSISSLYNVKNKGWHLYALKNRYAGNFPTIKTVMLTDKQKRFNFWISKELQHAIADRMAKKEQVIIFLNRRGYSFFIQCSQCSHIPSCHACSVSLTLHEEGYLSCHYCGHTVNTPTRCPQCAAGQDALIKHGIGTQQVVRILETMYPEARIGRADMDTTTKKKLWQQTLTDFEQGRLDILVGTQTITKGFHFPKVTLVGILWADVNLNFPVFNASETTLQQLIQVAGRAGRQSEESLVIVQAMADHEIFAYLNEIDYSQFYEKEIESRQALRYPPSARLLEIEVKHTDEQTVEREAHILATFLVSCKAHYPAITILGPAKPPVSKIKHICMRKIYLKGPNMFDMLAMVKEREKLELTSIIHLIPNPLN